MTGAGIKSYRQSCWLSACVMLAILIITPVDAHPANIPAATAKISADGSYQVDAKFDLLAFMLNDTPQRIGDGPMNDLLDGPAEALQASLTEATQRFKRDFAVVSGNTPGTVDSVVFPSLAQVQAWRDSGIKPRLPVMLSITIRGHLPPQAVDVSFRFPEVLGMLVLNTEFPYHEPSSEPLEAGTPSTPLTIPHDTGIIDPRLSIIAPKPQTHATMVKSAALQTKPVIARLKSPARTVIVKTPVVLKPKAVTKPSDPLSTVVLPAKFAHQTPQLKEGKSAPAVVQKLTIDLRQTRLAQTPQVVPSSQPLPGSGVSVFIKFYRYLEMGFHHILPEGTDHILFVLGLFLLSKRTKDLLWQISAFTVAHSITLALSLYGVVRLPPSIIEPVIAMSIAFVAIENLITTELKPWRPLVVFAFGLVHGMGFAGALKDLGLQHQDFLTALLGFNLGVEFGQLTVVSIAFLLVGWFRNRPKYRQFVVVPASFAIAAIALFWTAQRISIYYIPSSPHVSSCGPNKVAVSNMTYGKL